MGRMVASYQQVFFALIACKRWLRAWETQEELVALTRCLRDRQTKLELVARMR